MPRSESIKDYIEPHGDGYRISGTRVSVDSIIYSFKEGQSPEVLALCDAMPDTARYDLLLSHGGPDKPWRITCGIVTTKTPGRKRDPMVDLPRQEKISFEDRMDITPVTLLFLDTIASRETKILDRRWRHQ